MFIDPLVSLENLLRSHLLWPEDKMVSLIMRKVMIEYPPLCLHLFVEGRPGNRDGYGSQYRARVDPVQLLRQALIVGWGILIKSQHHACKGQDPALFEF